MSERERKRREKEQKATAKLAKANAIENVSRLGAEAQSPPSAKPSPKDKTSSLTPEQSFIECCSLESEGSDQKLISPTRVSGVIDESEISLKDLFNLKLQY